MDLSWIPHGRLYFLTVQKVTSGWTSSKIFDFPNEQSFAAKRSPLRFRSLSIWSNIKMKLTATTEDEAVSSIKFILVKILFWFFSFSTKVGTERIHFSRNFQTMFLDPFLICDLLPVPLCEKFFADQSIVLEEKSQLKTSKRERRV